MLKPYFETCGEGPDLVLLHGWGLHSGIWETLVDDLSRQFRLTLIDLPGFGRSPLPNQDYDMALLVEQILAVAPERAHYLGWSLGGLVTTAIASRHPDRVERLITVASNPRFVQGDDWPEAMAPTLMDSFCRFLEEDYEGTLIRFLAIQCMGSATQKDDIRRLKETVFMHGQPAKKALRGGLRILGSVDLRDEFSKLQQPLLRIYGRLDSLVPGKAADAIHELRPDSEQVTFRKAAHAPFLSHRQEFVDAVSEFLQ